MFTNPLSPVPKREKKSLLALLLLPLLTLLIWGSVDFLLRQPFLREKRAWDRTFHLSYNNSHYLIAEEIKELPQNSRVIGQVEHFFDPQQRVPDEVPNLSSTILALGETIYQLPDGQLAFLSDVKQGRYRLLKKYK